MAYVMNNFLKTIGTDFKIDALKKLNKYYMIGECPEREPQPLKALYYLKKEAELGDSEAQKDPGLAYLKGESGQPKDLDKAKRWLKKAASKGVQEAEEIIKKFDDKTVVEVAPEPEELLRKSNAEQFCELLKMTFEQSLQRHPYVKKDSNLIGEKSFEQFPESPTAQHHKKAFELRDRIVSAKKQTGRSTKTFVLQRRNRILWDGKKDNSVVVYMYSTRISKV